MKNILSYDNNSILNGQEIIDWITYQIVNNTSHKKNAEKLKKYLNVNPESKYRISRGTYQGSNGKIIFLKIK